MCVKYTCRSELSFFPYLINIYFETEKLRTAYAYFIGKAKLVCDECLQDLSFEEVLYETVTHKLWMVKRGTCPTIHLIIDHVLYGRGQ